MQLTLREVALPESLVNWVPKQGEPSATVVGNLGQVRAGQVFYALARIIGDDATGV